MAVNKFYDFPAGSKVGVIKHGSWGNVSQQGVYTVTKCNGTVCEITRDSDGYVRTFSNRTGIEKNSYSDRYNTAQLISLDRYEALSDQRKHAAKIAGLWQDATEAVSRKNTVALRTILELLEANGPV